MAAEAISVTNDRFGIPRCFTWLDPEINSHKSFFIFKNRLTQKFYGDFLENIILKEKFSHYRFKVTNCEDAFRYERLIINKAHFFEASHFKSFLNKSLDNEHEQIEQIIQGTQKSFDLSPKNLESIFTPFKKETNGNLIRYYGDQISSEIYLKWIDQKKLDSNCKNLIGSCDYYLCREKNHSCGSSGYYINFGYQYCSGSIELLLPEASAKGKTWLTNVATCLQEKMEDITYTQNCSEVKSRAIKDHDSCYSENKVCRLPIKDIFAIYKLIRPELTNPQIIFEGLQVAEKCLN